MKLTVHDKTTFTILGSNSFSGSSFISYLLRKLPDIKIIGISRSAEPIDAFLHYKSISGYMDRFEFHQLDLNKNIDEISELINSSRTTHIVNFAAQGMVAQSWDNPAQWINTNVVALASLLHALQSMKSIKSFTQASTPEVYGSSDSIKESTNYSPSTPYAASKAAADTLLCAYQKTKNFPVRFMRASNIFGPSQQLYRIIPKTVMTVLNGEKLPLHGGGVAERNFIHINDVCEAALNISMRGFSGGIYHISGKETISIYDLVCLICSLMGVNPEDHLIIEGERTGSDKKYLLDSTKIEKEFGLKPQKCLKQGIEEVIGWVKANYDELNLQPIKYIHKE